MELVNQVYDLIQVKPGECYKVHETHYLNSNCNGLPTDSCPIMRAVSADSHNLLSSFIQQMYMVEMENHDIVPLDFVMGNSYQPGDNVSYFDHAFGTKTNDLHKVYSREIQKDWELLVYHASYTGKIKRIFVDQNSSILQYQMKPERYFEGYHTSLNIRHTQISRMLNGTWMGV